VVAGLALVLVWFAVYRYWRGHGWYPQHPETYLLAGLWSGAAMALKRLAPLPLLALTVTVYPLLYGPSLQTEFHLLPVLIAGYAASSGGRWRAVLAWAAAASAVLLLTTSTTPAPAPALRPAPPGPVTTTDPRLGPAEDVARVLFNEFVTAGVLLLGFLVHEQRRTARDLAARNAELVKLREVEAARVIADERTRIARELHDAAAHHLTALIVRAQAADRVAATQPEAATEAMGWIVMTAKEALTAVRQTVRVLRTDPSLAPGPTLADLPTIAARVRDAGIDVELRLPDPLPPLEPQVELAAVRIAQEALTNTLRHAGAERAVVWLRAERGGIALDVDDDGRTETTGAPPAVAATGGNGLVGMRERAVSCGGTFDVGRSTLGGWRVRAWLPA
jgi:signal transduction histidine kinase